MALEETEGHKQFILPLTVIGPVDLGRLIREADAIDNALRELEIRKSGEIKMPKTSKMMDEVIQLNKLNLLLSDDRKQLITFLALVKKHAPLMHMSFSADPSPAFIVKMMTWLRQEIHPAVLLTVGLQPNIGAGCMVRTTNKYFDFSLRENFNKQREVLMAKLREVNGEPEAPVVAGVPVPTEAVAA